MKSSYLLYSMFFIFLKGSLSKGLFSKVNGNLKNPFLNRFSIKNPPYPVSKQCIIDYPKLTFENLTEQDNYDLQWYVIGPSYDFISDQPKKITIWDKDYVVWKNGRSNFFALDDACTHKGASLSDGKIQNANIVCPYHGYEFDCNGELKKVPGICFQPSSVQKMSKYKVAEKNGWIYLNTFSDLVQDLDSMKENIFVEEEVLREDTVQFFDMEYNCYSRILSENSLDIMHIGFVHTFGNARNPSPIEVYPPRLEGPHHFKTVYVYESGPNSIANKVFNAKHLTVENEFILPHTTVARIIFGEYVNTIITFALPIGENKSKLFVKTYRNFWKNPVGDKITRDLMYRTMLEDKRIIESIKPKSMEGKFNMRFDKLQNTYKTFYKRFIHRLKEP